MLPNSLLLTRKAAAATPTPIATTEVMDLAQDLDEELGRIVSVCSSGGLKSSLFSRLIFQDWRCRADDNPRSLTYRPMDKKFEVERLNWSEE
jgi:hypothetical protein